MGSCILVDKTQILPVIPYKICTVPHDLVLFFLSLASAVFKATENEVK